MTDTPTPLAAIRARLALAVGENAVFDGWTVIAVETAAGQLGIDPAQARLAFPKSKIDMVDAYIAAVDEAMLAAFPPDKIAAMKVRDRIRAQIWFRLETMAPAREALRSALSILAMPQNALRGARLGHGLEPEPELRANPVADLHRGNLVGSECGEHRVVDGSDIGVDHVDLRLGESEAGLGGIDPELASRGIDRHDRPAVEHGIFAHRQSEAGADCGERSRGVGHEAKVACRCVTRKRTRMRAVTISIAPSQSSPVSASS